MKAVVWHGKRDVRVDTVPDPIIQDPQDAIIRITSTAICGSDLHLYEVMVQFMEEGDIIGHEPMGIVEEVGPGITNLKPGDRVVIPFNIACGHCWMCTQDLQSQCETTQVREHDKGAALFGYTKLYGQVPGGQAEYLRVPQAQYTHIKVPDSDAPDDRFIYLSDVLPTAWQAVEYAQVPDGGTVLVLGLGPIGDMSTRIAQHRGYRVIAADLVPKRLARAQARGVEVVNVEEVDVAAVTREMTGGRGPDSVIDAVGLEAHGSPFGKLAQEMTGLMPKALSSRMMERVGVDRMNAFYTAIDAVRRGGTISLSGAYGGQTDPLPMFTLFDKQITLNMGQANVKRWTDQIMPLLTDNDVLGVDDFATHRLPIDDAPHAYEIFQKKQDGAIKILLKPNA